MIGMLVGEKRDSKKDLKYHKLSLFLIRCFVYFCFIFPHWTRILLRWYSFAFSSFSLLEVKLNVFNCKMLHVLCFLVENHLSITIHCKMSHCECR